MSRRLSIGIERGKSEDFQRERFSCLSARRGIKTSVAVSRPTAIDDVLATPAQLAWLPARAYRAPIILGMNQTSATTTTARCDRAYRIDVVRPFV